MKKPFKVMSTTALTAAFAAAAVVPVQAEVVNEVETSFSGIVFDVEGVNTVVSYSDYFNALIDLKEGNENELLDVIVGEDGLVKTPTYVQVGDNFYSASDYVDVVVNNEGSSLDELIQTLTSEKTPLTEEDTEDFVPYEPGDGELGDGELVVESVSAINSTEVAVTFNTQVLKSTIDDTEENFVLEANTPSEQDNVSPTSVELQGDGNTVILRFDQGDLVENTNYDITIAEGILSTDYEPLGEYEGNFTYNGDTTAPSLQGIQVVNDSLVLVFDEEINPATGILKVDGYEVDITGAANSGVAGDYAYLVTGEINPVVLERGTHNAQIVGLEDVAGNEAGTLTTTYTVAADTTPPEVTGIEALDTTAGNVFRVSFSEALSSAPNANNFKVMKGNTEYVVTDVTAVEDSAFTYDVTLAENAGTDADGEPINPLYAEDENTINLSVEISNYQDQVGLYGEVYNDTVTLERDSVAPGLLNESLNTFNDEGNIVIPFNEELREVDPEQITVLDPDGIAVTVEKATLQNGQRGENSAVLININAQPKLGDYTVTFGSGAVEDVARNDNNEITTTVTYEEEAVYFTPEDVDGGKNVIDINYAKDMTDSAIDTSNYLLDNEALPEGSTAVFVDGRDTVRITLPESFIVPDNANYKFEITQDVQSEDGEVVGDDSGEDTVNYTTLIQLVDNVAPELTNAVYALAEEGQETTSYILLTFSEGIQITEGADLSDNLSLTIAGNEVGTVSAVNTDENELLIEVEDADALNISQPAILTLDVDEDGEIVITDAADNQAVATTITVSESAVVDGVPVVDEDPEDDSDAEED